MKWISELWYWLGEHQTAAIVVIVIVGILAALAIVTNYDLSGVGEWVLRELGK